MKNKSLLISALFAFGCLAILLVVVIKVKSFESISVDYDYSVPPTRTVAVLETKPTPEPIVTLNTSLLKKYSFELLNSGGTKYMLLWSAYPVKKNAPIDGYMKYNITAPVDLVKVENDKTDIIKQGITRLNSFDPHGYFLIANQPRNSYVINIWQGAEGSDGRDDFIVNVKTGEVVTSYELYGDNYGYDIPYNSKYQILKFFAVSILKPFEDPFITLYSYNLVTGQKQPLWILDKGQQFECGGDYYSSFVYTYSGNKISVSNCDKNMNILETRSFDYY